MTKEEEKIFWSYRIKTKLEELDYDFKELAKAYEETKEDDKPFSKVVEPVKEDDIYDAVRKKRYPAEPTQQEENAWDEAMKDFLDSKSNWPTKEEWVKKFEETFEEAPKTFQLAFFNTYITILDWLKERMEKPEPQKWLEKTAGLRDKVHRLGNENEELKEDRDAAIKLADDRYDEVNRLRFDFTNLKEENKELKKENEELIEIVAKEFWNILEMDIIDEIKKKKTWQERFHELQNKKKNEQVQREPKKDEPEGTH